MPRTPARRTAPAESPLLAGSVVAFLVSLGLWFLGGGVALDALLRPGPLLGAAFGPGALLGLAVGWRARRRGQRDAVGTGLLVALWGAAPLLLAVWANQALDAAPRVSVPVVVRAVRNAQKGPPRVDLDGPDGAFTVGRDRAPGCAAGQAGRAEIAPGRLGWAWVVGVACGPAAGQEGGVAGETSVSPAP